MTITELDPIVDDVKTYFTSKIMELSNSEVEYILEQLVSVFDLLLERVKQEEE
jgi:hypothetical protein